MRDIFYDRNGKPITVEEMCSIPHEDKIIMRTKLSNKAVVSTVWLGIDHSFGDGPPLIFETMIFEKWDKQDLEECYCDRYTTEEEARAGHLRAIQEYCEKTGASIPPSAMTEKSRWELIAEENNVNRPTVKSRRSKRNRRESK